MRNTANVTGGKSIVTPLVAFYDIHGIKREVLFFYYVPDTTRERDREREREGGGQGYFLVSYFSIV
jgi:hypothetical protein